MKNKQLPLLAVGLMVLGAIGGTVYQVSAQSSSSQNTAPIVQNAESNTETEDVVSADLLSQVKITETQARQITLAANPNVGIKTVQIGDENGKVIYEIELSDNREIKIDAVNGSILKADVEDDEEGIDTDDIQDEQEGNDSEDDN
jgi:uncharacterized membrane protein YkoI